MDFTAGNPFAALRKNPHNAKATALCTVAHPLLYDCQGLYTKQAWKQIFDTHVTPEGSHIWQSYSTYLAMQREQSSTYMAKRTIDFKCGTGSRSEDKTRVAPCTKQYQRLIANKRRQYHWLDPLRPRVIPETHFSNTSAARQDQHLDPTTAKGKVWFAKIPGKQRGSGIKVLTSTELQHFQPTAPTIEVCCTFQFFLFFLFVHTID